MLRRLFFALGFCGVVLSLSFGDGGQDVKPKEKAILFPEQGRHHHLIATTNKEAQAFFDQGMTLVYGFNHAEAVRSFERAAELDPKSPMPHWGIAPALGPNYNREIDPIDDARRKAAFEAVRKSVELSKEGPAHECAYTEGLARRYAEDPKTETRPLEVSYMKAMRALVKQYPDDLDAQTLYADSLMVLRPWQLWDKDGRPAEETEEILKILEAVMLRDPDHIGANHLYIHAIEASPWPERGLPSAERLLRLVPWQGHLVHMPAHIYIHTGDHELAAKANLLGIKADEDYFRARPLQGTYPMYYYHNVHFLAFARAAQGHFEEAGAAAQKLHKLVEPIVEHMPPMEGFQLMPTQVLLRFHRWEDVLKLDAPPHKRKLSRVFWHYARGMAFAGQGKKEDAQKELGKFKELTGQKEFPTDAPVGANKIGTILAVAQLVLEARLAKDAPSVSLLLNRAIRREAALNYGEPPDWYYPVRESLGAALLRAGEPMAAEQVFRDDLKKNRRNPRSLFGLRESLKAQKKPHQAELVDREFRRAWKGPALRIDDF